MSLNAITFLLAPKSCVETSQKFPVLLNSPFILEEWPGESVWKGGLMFQNPFDSFTSSDTIDI